jgi:ABC-type phosphate transport system ATPase subunit
VQKGSWYEYEYVNTGEVFTRPETPSTNEEIKKTGHIWLQYKDELKERTAKMLSGKQKQTKLTNYFK